VKFKLDENFGSWAKEILGNEGHDARTVREEGLGGASDDAVIDAAVRESRVLVTMDLDFADVFRHPPTETPGVAILRPPGRATRAVLGTLLLSLVRALDRGDLRGGLWIVEAGRIREHEAHLRGDLGGSDLESGGAS
jgi:predicted nuclease of predicted toxin-antitoxin system